MASPEAVGDALEMLDLNWPDKAPTDPKKLAKRLALYTDALSELSDDDVIAAARVVVKREKFFPPAGVLLEAVRPAAVAKADVQAEAAAAYQRVLGCNTYTPEAGAFWSFRQIADEVGQVAAMSFTAAGGHEAFAAADPVGDQFRFKRFVEAFTLEAEARAREGLAIGAGAEARGLSRAEAREIMGRVAKPGPSGFVPIARALKPGAE
jgi:hypothetical protein